VSSKKKPRRNKRDGEGGPEREMKKKVKMNEKKRVGKRKIFAVSSKSCLTSVTR